MQRQMKREAGEMLVEILNIPDGIVLAVDGSGWLWTWAECS